MLETGREYEQGAAARVRTALSGSQQALDDFLISNELWGGPGSIPDSAFVSDQTRLARFEEMMIKLGRLQIEGGRTNVRTESWLRAFESWRDADLRQPLGPSRDFRFLHGISSARAVRFLIGAMILPGYLALRIPYWRRHLSKHPFLALAILAAYLVLVFLGLRCYETKTPQLDRTSTIF